MRFNVKEIYPEFDFFIEGASYVGEPRNNTIMYISKKIENLLVNLREVHDCLCFVETGIIIPDDAAQNNTLIFSDNPQLEYAKFAANYEKRIRSKESMSNYLMTKDGYYITADVKIGENAYIEPNVIIGPNVTIGNGACILGGAVIKNAIIGDNFLCNEKAVIGSNGFTMAADAECKKYRIPSLGKVIIGNNVEVGTYDNISRGSANNTIIGNSVKLDTQVHVGHDVQLGDNTEITAGVVVGGFVKTGRNVFIGINAAIRNRVMLGNNSRISMGAVVTQNVNEGETVTGNFAIPHNKFINDLRKSRCEV